MCFSILHSKFEILHSWLVRDDFAGGVTRAVTGARAPVQ